MTKPRIQVPTEDYTAEHAQRVLENLRSGPLGEGVITYRRFGGYFALTDDRRNPDVTEAAVHEEASPR